MARSGFEPSDLISNSGVFTTEYQVNSTVGFCWLMARADAVSIHIQPLVLLYFLDHATQFVRAAQISQALASGCSFLWLTDLLNHGDVSMSLGSRD